MEMMQTLQFRPLLPELFLCISAVFLLMAGVYRGDRSTGVVLLSAMMGIVTCILLVASGSDVSQQFGTMFLSDAFTRFAKILVLIGAGMALVMSHRWLDDESRRRFEYPVLVLFATLGMLLMISANHLLALYMGLELSSLALYVLAAFSRDDVRSSESGIKYFVLGSLASGMMLYGISLLYGFTGSLSFDALAESIAATLTPEGKTLSVGITIGMVLLLVGFCFKLAAAPFHMWTPDVYQGAPTPVTAFFAIAPKVAAFLLLVRVLQQPLLPLMPYWQELISAVAILSMVVGALGALTQTNIKRLLAYSSIGHAGYALVGVAAGGTEGAASVLVYMSLYIFGAAGSFACVLLMRRRDVYHEKISDLAGLWSTHPVMAITLMFLMFWMAGIPPFAGFFAKFFVFRAAIGAELYVLAVTGVLASVIACFYYLKIVRIMFFEEPVEPFDAKDRELYWIAGIAVAVTLLFLLAPSSLMRAAETAAQALLL